MKKLVFLFVAFVAVSFASCGGNKNANAESTEAAVVEELLLVIQFALIQQHVTQ